MPKTVLSLQKLAARKVAEVLTESNKTIFTQEATSFSCCNSTLHPVPSSTFCNFSCEEGNNDDNEKLYECSSYETNSLVYLINDFDIPKILLDDYDRMENIVTHELWELLYCDTRYQEMFQGLYLYFFLLRQLKDVISFSDNSITFLQLEAVTCKLKKLTTLTLAFCNLQFFSLNVDFFVFDYKYFPKIMHDDLVAKLKFLPSRLIPVLEVELVNSPNFLDSSVRDYCLHHLLLNLFKSIDPHVRQLFTICQKAISLSFYEKALREKTLNVKEHMYILLDKFLKLNRQKAQLTQNATVTIYPISTRNP